MTDLASSVAIAIMETRSYFGFFGKIEHRHINCCAMHMITECHNIIKAVDSNKPRRRIPSCFRHPDAQKNAVAEFKRAMKKRVIPMIENIIIGRKKSDEHAFYLGSGGGLNYPSYTCTEKLWEILGALMRTYAIDNMHIIARIYELDIIPQALHWYDDAISSIRRLGDWEIICEDGEHSLLQHSLLPHPDFFFHVINRPINHNKSWADVASSPPLMIDRGNPELIRLMKMVYHDSLPRPVEKCCQSSMKKNRNHSIIIFDETLDRAIDIAEIM